MTPPAAPAATTARTTRPARPAHGRRRARPAPGRPHRRVSGPASRGSRGTAAAAAASATAAAPALAPRGAGIALPRPRPRLRPVPRPATAPPRTAVERLAGLADHRWLDSLVRGRTWIVLLAVLLLGLVFLQVSMLRMNTDIGRQVERAGVLERENAALRASVSRLASGERLQAAAGRLGLVMPPAGDVRFLRTRDRDVADAVRTMRAPDGTTPPRALPPGSTPPQDGGAIAPAADPTATPTGTAAPAPTAPTAPAPAPTAPTAQTAPTPPDPTQPQPQAVPTAPPATATP